MKIARSGNVLAIDLDSVDDTAEFGRALAGLAAPGMVLGLVGPLGAGKTQLTRSIATALGVDPSAISSPTFVLIQEYQGRLPVYHFDTYRLKSAEQFEGLGPWEYFDGQGLCVIEWADRVADQLPPRTIWVRIEPTGPEARRARVEAADVDTLRILADRLGDFDAGAEPT